MQIRRSFGHVPLSSRTKQASGSTGTGEYRQALRAETLFTKEMLGDQIAIASPSSLHVSFSAYCQFVKVIFIAGEEEGRFLGQKRDPQSVPALSKSNLHQDFFFRHQKLGLSDFMQYSHG